MALSKIKRMELSKLKNKLLSMSNEEMFVSLFKCIREDEPVGDNQFKDTIRRSYRSSTGHVLEEYGDPEPSSRSKRSVFLDGVKQDRSFNDIMNEMYSGDA